MADIIFGVGCSHSPLLATKPEQWDLRANDDRKNPAHPFRGKVYTYAELEKLRKDENLSEQIRMDVRRERDARNQKNLSLLSDKIAAAKLDVLVVFGDDQHEVLMSDNMPGFMIFTGKDVPFKPTSEERLAAMSEGVRVANWARVPEKEMPLPGAPELGSHVAQSVVNDGFDVSMSDRFVDKHSRGDRHRPRLRLLLSPADGRFPQISRADHAADLHQHVLSAQPALGEARL